MSRAVEPLGDEEELTTEETAAREKYWGDRYAEEVSEPGGAPGLGGSTPQPSGVVTDSRRDPGSLTFPAGTSAHAETIRAGDIPALESRIHHGLVKGCHQCGRSGHDLKGSDIDAYHDESQCRLCDALAALDALLAEHGRAVTERDELSRIGQKDADRLLTFLHRAKAAEAALEAARKALNFYADSDNYFETYPDETDCPVECDVLKDDGAKARAALGAAADTAENE